MRIREGNDFTLNWEIERGGIAEDIQSAISRKLFLKRHREVREITDYEIIGEGNIIHAEFTPDMLFGLGDYVLELHYVLSDTSLSDEDRRCAVDVDAFTIVARTAMADNVTEMAQTSDIALALRGKSAYDLWLETHEGTKDDYFDYLRQPATDAAASLSILEQTVSGNEGLRVTAEKGRSDAELLREEAESARNDAEGIRDSAEDDRIEAEGIRDANETVRINAESDREDAEDLRDQAEVAREGAEEARANAEGDETKGRVKAENERVTAEELREEAEGLRELAEIARANAEGDATKGRVKAENDRVAAEILRNETFDQKMGEADGKIDEMDTTLSIYEGRMSQAESDIDQLAGDVEGTIEMPIAHALSQLKEEIDSLRILIEEGRINRMQIETLDVISEIRINGSPLIYVRDSAPSFSPDQVPQFYIDTSAGRFYAAKGTGSANDWF